MEVATISYMSKRMSWMSASLKLCTSRRIEAMRSFLKDSNSAVEEAPVEAEPSACLQGEISSE